SQGQDQHVAFTAIQYNGRHMNIRPKGNIIGEIGVHLLEEGQGKRRDRSRRQHQSALKSGVNHKLDLYITPFRQTEDDAEMHLEFVDLALYHSEVLTRVPP